MPAKPAASSSPPHITRARLPRAETNPLQSAHDHAVSAFDLRAGLHDPSFPTLTHRQPHPHDCYLKAASIPQQKPGKCNTNKHAVTSAVLDDYIADYIESLRMWNAEREVGNIEHALDGVVKVLRMGIFEGSSFRRSLDTSENAALYLEFVNRVADQTTSYIIDTTVRDYAKLHDIKIEHIYETFYMLILGLCGYIRTHRNVPDEVLKSLIAQTLHMERLSELP